MKNVAFVFEVTTSIDWSRGVEKVYCISSKHQNQELNYVEAKKYMNTLTDDDETEKDFADFRYVGPISVFQIPEDGLVYSIDGSEGIGFVVEFTDTKQERLSFLDWWVVRKNGIPIGSIGRNNLIETEYGFRSLNRFNVWETSSGHKDLESAKKAAFAYAESLKGEF